MYNQVKIYDKHVAFWGSILSNFYPCKIEAYDEVWKSSEQCFMAQKALFFEDQETYEEILDAKTPEEAKKLGRQVKNYNDEEWSEVREEIMYTINYEKYAQNKDLRDFLLSEKFKNKKFVEGSPFDGVWGVKIDYRNESIDDENNWKGTNLLGKVLDRVRFNLTH